MAMMPIMTLTHVLHLKNKKNILKVKRRNEYTMRTYYVLHPFESNNEPKLRIISLENDTTT